MKTVPATHATVIVEGRPPSLNARYGHHMARHREVAMWRERSHLRALEARNAAGWGPPVKCEPPAPRWLEIDAYRVGVLDEFENAPGSLKPIIDGLAGALLVDDSSRWCKVVRFDPHRVAGPSEERTEITVHLVDPRRAEASE